MLRRRLFVAAVWVASIPLWPMQAARAQEPARLVLGTATPGGGFRAYGEALAAAVREASPTVELELRATGGSAENLALLRDGKLDLALVQGEFAYKALAAEEDRPKLTVVAPIYATPGLFVVPASSPIRSVEDLRGREVALGTRNSGLTMMARAVLRGSGIDPDHDIQPILLDRAGDGPGMVLDGRAAALWGGGLGWPGFRTLAETPGGARFFGPAPQAIDRILALSPSLRRMTVPASSFPLQTEAIETVGSWSFIIAKPGLDPAAVSRLVRAIDLGQSALARRLPQGRASDPRDLAGVVPATWLHPATVAFLREVGAYPK
ncbi:TAXI family TRAP transporter solute-binding subunit [Methylobacterium nodulans]|uniref:TRAP transporter solute receptor, TAXI family n=1 Tax=Methylobacterium nodulans (strain LMG 21967 / CNCM I-2342 / ORS 2060) TaxID=460265 RepID=B8IA32_METNO|nr:TAXI family TRAP transporter solute-binding subunit [Methylobacterium nodulans]ACL57260.1 TRAP transporter solute receptor, TAXI family [Methylobacterium nodulans ORS 2060]